MHKKKNQQLKDQKIKKRYNRVQFELFYLQEKKERHEKHPPIIHTNTFI